MENIRKILYSRFTVPLIVSKLFVTRFVPQKITALVESDGIVNVASDPPHPAAP